METQHLPGESSRTAPDQSVTTTVEVKTSSDRSLRSMALSLLILLVPIGLVFAFNRLVLDGGEPVPVDTTETIAYARSVNAFPVSEPTGLDSGWRPVNVDFRQVDGGRTLRIGYVSPDGEGVQVVQSNVPAEQLLPAELTDEAQLQGTVELAGRTWQRYTARPGERAVVLLEHDRTVIVVGSADERELHDLASKLS